MINIGIEDDKFIRGKVPMTKQEIRILTLAKAKITESDFVVDVGAGTGSLSIEAARIAARGYVFAIDKNPEAVEIITQNAEKFSVDNLVIIHAEAPKGLKNVPRIDVALIGGTGGQISEILDTVDAKLKIGGRIILNCVTVQTLANGLSWFKTHGGYKYDAIQVQINRLQNVGSYDMAKALNPVHIVTAKKSRLKQVNNVLNFSEAKIKNVQATPQNLNVQMGTQLSDTVAKEESL